MSIIVKICGLSEESSIQAVVKASAQYAGFVTFPKSPRHVSPKRAGELKKGLPAHVKTASVLVDPDDALLAEIVRDFAPDYFQLHGSETPERIAQIKTSFPGTGIIKAIKVSSRADIKSARAFEAVADMLMFDAMPPKDAALPGGNGVAFDWTLLSGQSFARPWLLSGGLTPQNVAQAVRESGAKMVDVSSGVESSAGVKDPEKIAQFVEAAKK